MRMGSSGKSIGGNLETQAPWPLVFTRALRALSFSGSTTGVWALFLSFKEQKKALFRTKKLLTIHNSNSLHNLHTSAASGGVFAPATGTLQQEICGNRLWLSWGRGGRGLQLSWGLFCAWSPCHPSDPKWHQMALPSTVLVLSSTPTPCTGWVWSVSCRARSHSDCKSCILHYSSSIPNSYYYHLLLSTMIYS